MKCSIIVPSYNEENRIANCLNQLVSLLPKNYEIIVAADGCTDRTVEIARQFPVKIATYYRRLGKGAGILNALHLADGEAIAFCDVDLSVSAIKIPLLVKELENADLVVVKRIAYGYPLHRYFLSRVFNLLFRILFRINILDTQCGFKAIWRKVLEDLSRDLHIKGFAFDVELIVKAYRRGYKVKEFPLEWHYKGGSKVNVPRQSFLWQETCLGYGRMFVGKLKILASLLLF